MGHEINPTAMFGGIYQHEQESNEQAMRSEGFKTVAASKDKEGERRCHSNNQKGIQDPKPKTSLYLPADKMHALRVHCAEEEVKITAFVEKAIDAQIKSDLKKRKGFDAKEE